LADPARLPELDPWVTENLDRLATLEAGWAEAAAGDTLLHADLRADNILLTESRVVLVDWPWARIGAAWTDLLLMLPSVAMQGGPPPEEVFEGHPVGRGADRDAVTPVLAAFAGFMINGSTQPAVPGIPALRLGRFPGQLSDNDSPSPSRPSPIGTSKPRPAQGSGTHAAW
jgi:hypothetical protein